MKSNKSLEERAEELKHNPENKWDKYDSGVLIGMSLGMGSMFLGPMVYSFTDNLIASIIVGASSFLGGISLASYSHDKGWKRSVQNYRKTNENEE